MEGPFIPRREPMPEFNLRRALFAVSLPLALLAAGSPSLATPAPLEVPPADAPLVIDGRLDESAWQRAARIPLEYEVYPGENSPAPVKTECLVLRTPAALYVAFRASDPDPRAIRAHLSDRDRAARNDIVGIVLDPFQDGRRGFAFMTNPLGVQMDAVVSGVGTPGGYGSMSGAPSEDYSWDAIWDSAGRIGPDGFTVEFAIPWPALRFPDGAGVQTWSVIAFRSLPRTVRRRLMSVPQDLGQGCYLCEANQITGLAGMRPGLGLEVAPTLTYNRSEAREEFPSAPLEETESEGEFGVSTRWSVTPNLALNATFQPDFSQIEADAARLEVNRRFAIFFPEKRPFFLEGADLFKTLFNAVHTRSVVDPRWGLKLSGKEGRHAIGAFVTRDRATSVIVPSNESSRGTLLDVENTSAVARYRRDVGQASNIGLLATYRDAEDGTRNRVLGIDALLRLGPHDLVKVQIADSETEYGSALLSLDEDGDGSADFADQPDGRFDGHAAWFRYQHADGAWEWWLAGKERSPGLRMDNGFMPRVDTRAWGAGLRRQFFGPADAWYTRLRFTLDATVARRLDGQLTDENFGAHALYEGPMQSLLRLSLYKTKIFFEGRLFEQDRVGGFFNIRPSGDLTASIDFSIGDGIDFTGSRPARTLRLQPGVTWNIGRHFFVQFDHTYEQLEVGGEELFTANLSQARVVYHFNRRLLLRAILQHRLIERSPELYEDEVDSESRTLFSQYLVSYKVNPQTVLFLGYSDNRLGDQDLGLTTEGRTFFLKLGYAWVL